MSSDAVAGVFIALWISVALLMVLGCFGACAAFAAFIKFNSKQCVQARQEAERRRDKAESRAIWVAQKAAAFASNEAAGAQRAWSAVTLLDDAEDEVEVRISLAVLPSKPSFTAASSGALQRLSSRRRQNVWLPEE